MQLSQLPQFQYLHTFPLRHQGDCSFLGVSPDMTLYVEEVYGSEGWLAQHALSYDGTVLETIDESDGKAQDLTPLRLPDDLIEPHRGWHTMALNFTGPRHRGLRGPARLDDLVRPISVQEKFALVQRLKLDILPSMLLGLAESYVMAEASIVYPNLFLVCRRLRLACALPEEQVDEENEPYDYDTLVRYAAHVFDTSADQELALSESFRDLPGASFQRPMDCMIYKEHVFIADGGEAERSSVIHVWRLAGSAHERSDDEALRRKLYR
jgi:hypothetical protein